MQFLLDVSLENYRRMDNCFLAVGCFVLVVVLVIFLLVVFVAVVASCAVYLLVRSFRSKAWQLLLPEVYVTRCVTRQCLLPAVTLTQTHTHTHTHAQADRQTNRRTHTHIHRQTDRQTDTHTVKC